MKETKLLSLLLLLICALSACGDDEEEKVVNKDDEKVDSTEVIPQWPTEEEMTSTIYYPVGTKWEEVWGAWRMKGTADDDSQTDAYPYTLKHNIREYYENYPYTLFTTTYEVKEDVEVDGKIYHYIEISNDFVAPEEGKTSWPLLGSMPKDLFIREDNGLIYRHQAYGVTSRRVDTEYSALAYNFVWTEGALIQRVSLTTFGEDSSYEDQMETFGTVDSTSVENVKMADGSYCLYMPSAGLYRGIGTEEGGLFPDVNAIRPTTSFEIVCEPIYLKRFWRNGVLLYENDKAAN